MGEASNRTRVVVASMISNTADFEIYKSEVRSLGLKLDDDIMFSAFSALHAMRAATSTLAHCTKIASGEGIAVDVN